MERFVAVVKQYPGQQQVDLAVEIEVPGSWFGAGPMGSLTATEQCEKYKAQAVEYAEVHEFPGATKGARKTREKSIRFICITDATAEPNSEGYWMKLSQWNRYRNDTFSGFFFARARQASGFRGNRWCCQEGANECSLTCSS